ncbi:tRNA (adenosine(37)-N6)-dimethylallyltransferase MiaA [Prosthecochloris sp. N3]|uniref:tRNA dimethylallyltransferase n=1 Tax=Prosthecochloris ethylica TaxID=2743976 RepID=A0ABR9XSQ8_9CHLB|nr:MULTISPECIES: tRNA (adenosine(37)-N6)-dimethylallyltransferase MiaA [Prosthecochloris]MBF0585386.1 tRNA (adenosine(37)-N6)-dimethylallyltransferase MiaA [Prosthecochloris ethylica]MBF0636922.1 tRNA (adenosine(37)-N6)-dimethylallyltransferase MiaA [Prosthecochloris ethylica]NUK46615.1 tRNA (adenosine(37)-N6)-dimethylallyltransferase MiaA [Prosthecochloris ethylica]RNA64772.1 tRNA (adenosine(37)-N6)-dimethylallyltransferase MiaA [Prosthecochloris sp. ZM_2]
MSDRHRPVSIPVVTGPTASGKSQLAHELARRTGAEIISADSRQIYRDMTIGTAKPDTGMLSEVPYHFIDERDITQEFSAGDFAAEALRRIETIIGREKPVIVVGGSTLYIQGLLEGFSDLPEKNPAIRKRLEEEYRTIGGETLYERLRDCDPRQAATLDPTKSQRLIRSLEIIEITGKTVTELHRQRKRPPEHLKFYPLALDMPREKLYRRIEQRTDLMIEQGLVTEAEKLYTRYRELLPQSPPNALMTVGYKELFQYLDGEVTLEQAVRLIKQHTRNYAKRQLTFFKNRSNVDWIAAPDDRNSSKRTIELLSQRFFPA